MVTRREHRDEYDRLHHIIHSWNEKRVELFKISLPNEKCDFDGVMKFFYQYEEIDGQKVATKCIRVSSNATVTDVIEILVQKFRPNLKMLPNISSFSLYEIHDENGEKDVRKMDHDEKPLWEMMKWSRGDREGRFLLRNESSFSYFNNGQKKNASPKKTKNSPKNQKERRKLKPRNRGDGSRVDNSSKLEEASVYNNDKFADTLYENYPSSKFTRSITNPEIVKNLWNSTKDKRLRGSYQEIDELGSEESTVTIITESLTPEFPSKTILATNNDTAAQIVRSAVEKFKIDADPTDFCLVEVTTLSNRREGKTENVKRILSDEECPVKIHTRWMLGEPSTVSHNTQQFQLRRRVSFNDHLKSPKPVTTVDTRYHEHSQPCLIDLCQTPPSTPSHFQKKHTISSFPVDIGSLSFLLNPNSNICLSSPTIAPKHCCISLTYRGTYAIEPLDPKALVYVNDKIVQKTTPLQLDSIIKLGEHNIFKFTISNQSNHCRSNSALTNHTGTDKVRDRLDKTYSIDSLTPIYNEKEDQLNAPEHPTHNRTISEHTLKGEVMEGEQEEEEHDCYDTTDDDMSMTNIKTTRNVKKRHNSAPHSGDLQFLEETPESELAVLPASISFSPQNENILLQTLITEVNGNTLEFKLAPAYSLYMIARHHLSSDYHPDSTRHHSLIHMIKQTCSRIKRTVKDSKSVAGALAFWLSNTSELLHFLRRDYRLCMFAHEYENTLTSIIHMAYKHFTEYLVCEIGMFLSAFLSESSEADKEDLIISKHEREFDYSNEPDVVPHGTLTRQASLTSLYWLAANPRVPRKAKATLGCVLSTLKAAVSLLHQCQVNDTLSIIIFNLLFRYISMRLFNKLVTDPKCCKQSIGAKLLRRLNRLKAWAIKEGLNMPAEDHLTIIFQAGIFLQYPKTNPDDVRAIHRSCDRLNSSQVTALIENYEVVEGEGSVNAMLKEQLIALAAQNVDQGLISSGLDITLQEDPNLELPFLIPEQGYSCDTMRGLPVGLEEYLDHAINSGLCVLHITKDTLGCWVPPRMTTSNQRESPLSTQASTQMSQTLPKNFLTNPYASLGDHDIQRPHSVLNLVSSDLGDQIKTVTVKLRKADKTLGINICEGRVNLGPNQDELLIFIKSLSDDGPAKKNGRVDAGDQILKVDSTVLKGYTKQMVIKLLSNSRNEVTLKLAKRAAEHYGLMTLPDSSPFTERKGQSVVPQSYESSHSIKAHRRQLRQQQNDFNIYRQLSHQPDYHPPNYNGYNQTAQWIQEQRDRHHYRPTDYLKQAARPTQSLNSLIPEKDERSSRHARGNTNKSLFDSDLVLKSTPTGSDTSDSASQLYPQGTFDSSRFNILGTASKLHDPISASKSDTSNYPMFSTHRSSVDSQYTGGDGPTTLSLQMSGLSDQNESQAYPTLVLEKLSMEVGCHTQSNTSSAGLTFASVLDQLAQKSREAKEKSGLKKSEVKGLDLDELDLEKQRMKFLFYQQRNDKKDTEPLSTLDKQPPLDSNAKVSEWVNKDLDMLTEDDELHVLMDPEKLLQITNLQHKVDSLKKAISEQRKKYREIQFAKERVKQCLAEEEKKSQQARNFRPFVKLEDQTRWQKDQKKRLKEWEKLKREKTNELQRYDCKERESRSRLKALEQHLGELKKQLLACDSSISRVLSATDEFGSSKLVNDTPERDWTNPTRPPRIMSTDSITTESSLMSGENPDIPKDLMSLGSDLSIPGLNDYNISGARNSPFSNRSDSSSPVGPVSYKGRYTYNPDVHGSMEIRPTAQQHMVNSKLPLIRGHSVDQERRLRMLKEEHHHHICSTDNIPSYSNEERALQLHQLRQEAMQNIDTPERSAGLNSSAHPWSKSSTNVSHYKGSIDSSNVESSLSNTPDVIPEFYVKPIHQSSSAVNLPYQSEGTKSSVYGKHSRPSSGFGFSSRGGIYHSAASSTNNSTEFLNGRVNSREVLFDKPEKLVSGIHVYSSHGNVSNINHQRSNHVFENDPHQQNDTSRLNHSKKITRQANSPSTHKYSHRRPDASLNGDDRSKYRPHTSSSHSNLLSASNKVQRQQTEL